MSPPIEKHEQTLELLSGAAMQVTLISSTGAEESWMIPKALLAHHSGYFQRLRNFKEGEQGKVALESFEPKIFKLFVQFIYFGQYIDRDDMGDDLGSYYGIRDSAKAWVLGDYLDAIEFKNFAMRNLYNVFFPPFPQRPKSGVGPDAIDYYFAMAPPCSRLYHFFLDVLIFYWDDAYLFYWDNAYVVNYTDANRGQWEEIWEEQPTLRNDLLFYTNMSKRTKRRRHEKLDKYMEESTVSDESVRSESSADESTSS